MTAPLLLSSGRVQYNEPTPDDNDVQSLSLNRDGRLRVASKQALFALTVGTLDVLNSAVSLSVEQASNVVCHVKNTGTAAMAAGSFGFEGSLDSTNGTDGTWFTVQAVRSSSNTVETNTGPLGLAAGGAMAYAWEVSVNAVKWFRIRTTVDVTASSLATWTILPGGYATEPIPAIQRSTVDVAGTVPVSGTVGVSGTVPVSGAVTTSGTATATPVAASAYSLVSAATTNAAVVKATAGNLFEISIFNSTAASIYVKLYNKASAPTVGTDVPLITIPVGVAGVGVYQFGALGKRFTAGIGIAITGASAATDATAVAVGAQVSASYL